MGVPCTKALVEQDCRSRSIGKPDRQHATMLRFALNRSDGHSEPNKITIKIAFNHLEHCSWRRLQAIHTYNLSCQKRLGRFE